MGAKRIRLSDDAGSNWWTLPGNSGEFNAEANQINDTTFGKTFESNQPGLIAGMVSANALHKGFSGYVATLKKGGTPTAMTGEATTLVSGKTYKITAGTKQVISYASAITVLDNAVDHTADVESIDYLAGTVTFKSAYTVTGPVTITGSYIPMTTIAKCKGYNLTQNAGEIDTTDFETAQANSGHRTYDPGLRRVALELTGIYAAANGWQAALDGRSLIYVEIGPDGVPANTCFRGFFKPSRRAQQGNVGELEEETINLGLWVPDSDLVLLPFQWYWGSGSVMNQAIRKSLTAWQNETKIGVRYLPDGATGFQCLSAIVTEASLQNSVDGMNEFRMSYRIDGTVTAVP